MIEIHAVLDKEGILKSCKVRGHAMAGSQGTDVVCAAVSVLTRTALRVFTRQAEIQVQGGAPERGVFWMETAYTSGAGRDFLWGAGNFLLEGLGSVSAEYPECCKMTIYTERN